MKIAPEFIEIIEELSAVGLRKMVKMYTFDEGMNVKPDEKDKIANPASIAAFFLSVIAGVLLYFKYDQGLVVAISVMIGIIA